MNIYVGCCTFDALGSASECLKVRSVDRVPDLSPFFMRQYVKEHSGDVFECYRELLTEMCLRLPYQVYAVTIVHVVLSFLKMNSVFFFRSTRLSQWFSRRIKRNGNGCCASMFPLLMPRLLNVKRKK